MKVFISHFFLEFSLKLTMEKLCSCLMAHYGKLQEMFTILVLAQESSKYTL